MKEKTKYIVVIILAVLFLAGWGEKEAELLDDKKLINLDKAIGYTMPGGDWRENISDDQDDGKVAEFNDDIDSYDDQEAIEKGENIIVVSVRNETITYDGHSIIGLNKLEQEIRDANNEGVSFSLVDDFAEAHIYKEVRGLLTKLKVEIGISYSEN